MLEGMNGVVKNVDWAHITPFAALVVGKPLLENRPVMTRLIEQSFVGILAAAIGSYVTLQIHQTEIDNLKQARILTEQLRIADQAKTTAAIEASELRVTNQISELRQILLKK